MGLFGTRRRQREGDGRTVTLAPWVRELLLHGRWPERDTPEWSAFERLEDQAAVWRRYEAELLMEWIAENPGTRPATWWRDVATEPRRVTRQAGMVIHDIPGGWSDAGVPLIWHAGTFLFEGRYEVESQAAYLRRLKLLREGEAKRLPADAWRPEQRGRAGVTTRRALRVGGR